MRKKHPPPPIEELPPPQRLFATRDEAHSAMLATINQACQKAKLLGCFPNEKVFLKTMRETWNIWQRYCPST